MGRSLVLGHTLCVLATLRGRQLCYPHLPIAGTHGQGGITAVGKELGLGINEKRDIRKKLRR